MAKPSLVLGIDPIPEVADVHQLEAINAKTQSPPTSSFESFAAVVHNHCKVLEAVSASLHSSSGVALSQPSATLPWIKPNLSFFLRFGSKGVDLLERCVESWRGTFRTLLDAKFSEIGNSLQRSLEFAFEHLQVEAVTVNPFLGQQSIETALSCAKNRTNCSGRVFFLVKTSETPSGTLEYLQHNAEPLISEICVLHDKVFGAPLSAASSVGPRSGAGVVIGANHSTLLQSPFLLESGLAVLAPGLGAQGASLDVVNRVGHLPEILFPLSRGIFNGSAANADQALERIKFYQELFSRAPRAERFR